MVDVKRQFSDACILEVQVQTNGLQGGDAGHGSHTVVALRDLGGTDLSVRFDESSRGAIIEVQGDAELRVLAQALRFAADALDLEL